MHKIAGIRSELKNIDALSGFFLILWLCSMISIPIQRWMWGDGAELRGTTIGVVLQMITVLVLLRRVWDVRRILSVSLVIISFAWAVEWLGSSTGIPFGLYHYTDRLQPQLMGVPWLIPMAWLMMIPPSWAVASRIVGSWPASWFPLVSALAFTTWDLFLDPQMVHWELWRWDQPGGYFGIPWINFVGWMMSVALLTVILRPAPVANGGLVVVYILTWLLESIALIFFWNLPGPGLFGFVAMGVFVLAASLRRRP